MDSVLNILEKVGAILPNDHFVGTSGKHIDTYINKDALFPHTAETSAVGKLFAEKFKDENIETVAAPAIGGVILAQWTAFHLSALTGREVFGVYAEKKDNELKFTRGYDKYIAGKRVLVIEDLTTTGGSLKQVVDAAKSVGGEVVAACVMVNKDPKNVNASTFGVPFSALAEMSVASYEESDCPLCKNNVPINTTVGHGKQFIEEKK